jgi:hypothetical protein
MSEADSIVDRLLPPIPVLRLTRQQQLFWDEFLETHDFERAMRQSCCSIKDAQLVHERVGIYEERFTFRRLAALWHIGCHIGMWGKLRPILEAAGRSYPNEPDLSQALLKVVLLPEANAVERCVYSMLLDYFDPPWRSRLSPEALGIVLKRDDPEVLQWRKAVLKRDGCRCQRCGVTARLNVHHVVGWASNPALRVIPSNGVTLCEDCHNSIHHPVV